MENLNNGYKSLKTLEYHKIIEKLSSYALAVKLPENVC